MMQNMQYRSIKSTIEWAQRQGEKYVEFGYLNDDIVDRLKQEGFHVTIAGEKRLYYVRWSFS